MAWIGLYRPAEAELLSLAEEFGLHELAVEDAIVAHQRPKLDRYGNTLFVVLRAARYLDAAEEVDFGELHVFIGGDFVLTVRHAEAPNLATVRRRMEADPQLLAHGPEAVLYAILDAVVDGYAPVVAGLQNDIDEIETEVFRGDPAVSRRIYELSREVIEFQRATRPLVGMLDALMAGFDKYGIDEELRRYLRDVADHATTVVERVDGFRQMLQDILTVNATLVSQAQNEETKHLTRGQLRSERRDQEDLRMGRHPVRPHPHRHHLRHELRPHARAALDHRLPLRPRPHGPGLHGPVHRIQTPQLALTSPQTPDTGPTATTRRAARRRRIPQ